MTVVKVEIDNAFGAGISATLGVIVAFALFLFVADLFLQEDVTASDVRANCARHHGVSSIDDGTTFMQGETFVICRDGWFERVDN